NRDLGTKELIGNGSRMEPGAESIIQSVDEGCKLMIEKLARCNRSKQRAWLEAKTRCKISGVEVPAGFIDEPADHTDAVLDLGVITVVRGGGNRQPGLQVELMGEKNEICPERVLDFALPGLALPNQLNAIIAADRRKQVAVVMKLREYDRHNCYRTKARMKRSKVIRRAAEDLAVVDGRA